MSERLTSGDLVGPANALSAALREGVSMEECCRRVLAAHTPDAGAQPVAWALYWDEGKLAMTTANEAIADVWDQGEVTPLYTHPTPPRASVAASDEPGAVPLIERSREWWAARAEREGNAVVSAGAPDSSASTIPRRIQLNRFTPAERAIYDAVQVVEAAGADVRLTDAVVLLQAARDSVADFVDGIDSRRYVAAPRADATAADYAITLQRMIEAHCRGERVDETLSPHLGAMLNAKLAAPVAPCEREDVDAMLRHVAYDLSGTDRPMIECDTERLSALLRSLTTQPHPDAAARDAARYRWLRDFLSAERFDRTGWCVGVDADGLREALATALHFDTSDDVDIEAAIDAAMRASDGVGGEG